MNVRTPWFESWAARIGVAVLVALSAIIGFVYWDAQGDRQLAIITIGAELIAFAGLAVARFQFPNKRWFSGCGALIVTVLAAAWCGFTMYQKIDADTRAKALAAARERPVYVFADNAATSAATALNAQLARQPPTCICPDTIRAWEESQAAAIDRLRSERDGSVARLEEAMPPIATDWLAIIRGVGVEAAKLLGFMVFGLWAAPKPAVRGRAAARQPPKSAPEPAPAPRPILLPFRKISEKAAALAALLFPAAALAPPHAEAAAPAVDPISHEVQIGETDDGSSEFGGPVDADPAPVKSKHRAAPPSLPMELAVRMADDYAHRNRGKFSSHLLAKEVAPSQSTIARSLMAARERGMLDGKPWARKWLRARGVR